MKRCPTCNRVEADDALTFCRIDGVTLVPHINATSEMATAQLGAASADVQTTLLPHTTDAGMSRPTMPTTVLPGESKPARREPKAKRIKWVIAGIALVLAFVVIGFFFLKERNKAFIQSIAVMPFVNEGNNPEVDYLSDGMTETLIGSLSQVPNLNVKASSSVFRYKGKDSHPQTIGRELSVQAILNGRVARFGDKLRLSLELIDAHTENVIWSEQYNRTQAELVSLQSEIARDVSSKLQTRLSGTTSAKVAQNYTKNPEAYQLYLQGRYFWNKRTPQYIQKSAEYFQKAIEKDPNYALGYAGLSDAYTLLGYYGGAPPLEVFPKAKEAALKAVALDANLPEAHNALGFVLVLQDYDYAGAEREYRRVIAINPNDAFAHQNLGVMLNRIGRGEEGMVELRRALEIEPVSIIVNRLYGDILVHTKRYDEALVQLTKTRELDPSFATTHLSCAALYQLTGKYSESVESFATYLELLGRKQSAQLARDSFAAKGWQGYLREMTGPNRPPGVSAYMAATFFIQLGEKDKAFAELNRALENREWLLLYVKIDPRIDPLRNDPRLQEILRKMKFPE
jgi:TolB-like protein